MYNGYPVTIRTQGLVITRTYLDPDKSGRDDECTEVVMIDSEYTKPVKTDITVELSKSDESVIWHSAREMRASDDYREWCEAVYCP